MKGIQNKVVVITGASSGLGEETARYLASLGAKVVLSARRMERLEKIVADIQANNGQALAVMTDVTDVQQVQRLVDQTIDHFGRVDVMINNAGLMALAPLSKCQLDEWNRMIDINIKGVLNGIAAVLPAMQAQKSGQIINISSVAGLRVPNGGAVYSATKFAVKAISEGLRMEVAQYGIRVTTLYPGAIDSELKYGSRDAETRARIETFYEATQISADAIARAIAYAIEQPDDVAINEITVRPTQQDF